MYALGKQVLPECRKQLDELQEASAEAVLRLDEAVEKEAETAAALEEADRRLRALKLDRERMKDLEGREAQHVQVRKPGCVQRCSAGSLRACSCHVSASGPVIVQACVLVPYMVR